MMQEMPDTIQELFTAVFEPKKQFPRWFQPNKNIGQILVHTQEEEDALRNRDWTPKPLPGSEGPVAKMTPEQKVAQLQEQMGAMAEQLAALLAQRAAAPATGGAAAPTETEDGTEVPGALSDVGEADSQG